MTVALCFIKFHFNSVGGVVCTYTSKQEGLFYHFLSFCIVFGADPFYPNLSEKCAMVTVSRSAAANEYLDGFCATEVLQREVSQTQIVPSPNFSAKQNWYDLEHNLLVIP